jgi:predicted PurR-regulated permease PerM
MAVLHSLVAIALTGSAILLAVALEHAVQMLVKRRVRRWLAIAIVSVLVLGLLVGLAFTLIPPAVSQGRALIEQAPEFIRKARASMLFQQLDHRFHLAARIQEATRSVPEMLEGAATPILTAVGSVVSFLGAAITIYFLMVFMLIFGGRLIRAALDEARIERRPVYEKVLAKIYRSIGGYLAGLTLICTINATCTTTFLAIVRVPFFLPLGILAGSSSMIPYAGPFVTGTFISLIVLFTKGAGYGAACAVYFIAYGQIEGNILGPLIFRRTVHVNPLVVTVSILFFGEIAGILGAVVAVPVVAAFQIVLREVLRVRREQLALQRATDAPHAPGGAGGGGATRA